MRLKSFVSAATVSTILKNGGFNKQGYRLLDCTSTSILKNGYKNFNKTLYGKFEALMSLESNANKEYMKEHIPEAVHLDLAVGTHPRLYQAYTMYPPELFQRYMRRLGINADDALVLYGRNELHGMLYSCATAYLLKTFGHEKVSVLDGGLLQWKKHGGEVTQEVPKLPEGDWKASLERSRVINYDELTKRDKAGNDLFDKIGSVNWLDARPRGQFLGEEPTGLDPQSVPGSCIPGSKSAPVEELFVNGVLRPVDEIRKWLVECGYERGKPIITSCGRGLQASVLAFIIEYTDPSVKPRVYGGSLMELEGKNPKKISGGKVCTR